MLLLAALTAIASVAAQQTSRHNVSGDTVAIYNLVGDVRVEGGSGTAVTVEVTRVGRDAGQLRIETGPIRGRETLRVLYPDDDIVLPGRNGWWNTELRVRDDGTFNDDERCGDGDPDDCQSRRRGRSGRLIRIKSRGEGVEVGADLRVTVPRGQKVAVYLGIGRAMVSNVEGHLRVDVSAADVTADHTKGTLIIDTGSGEVNVTDAEGHVNLDTGSGSVAVTRMKGTSLLIDTGSGEVNATDVDATDINIDTGSGSVDLRNARARVLHVDTGSGEVEVRLLAPSEDINIDTGSGSVTLAVPEGLNAMVEIETGSGGIDLGFPVQVRRLESDHVTGQIGDGRGRLRIDTGSGSVRLIKI
jgi:lia operon protein LiaG